ncbi:hypothetical protein AB0H07_40545 [Streptomyces sp. NPDC021354]|uniref:hypothetical protein n=1 Tax=Streptomyces sp. NPDC021354 TaxID=3154793 RepID=UPI0033F1FAE8
MPKALIQYEDGSEQEVTTFGGQIWAEHADGSRCPRTGNSKHRQRPLDPRCPGRVRYMARCRACGWEREDRTYAPLRKKTKLHAPICDDQQPQRMTAKEWYEMRSKESRISDPVGHIKARLPHPGEPRHPSPPPACTVTTHECALDGCQLCEARKAIAEGRDVLADVEIKLREVCDLLEAAAAVGPGPHDVLVPYLPSPMFVAGAEPASGALMDAAYRAAEASQTLVMAARGQHIGYLARAGSHLTAAAYATARVMDRHLVLGPMEPDAAANT